MIDFKKAIHLVSGISAEGCLKEYFRREYPDDKIQTNSSYGYHLSVGPLTDFTSHADFEKYTSYWRTIDEICHSSQEEDEDYPSFPQNVEIDFSKDTPLIIWHGNETNEKLMLYRYSSLLKNRDLYEINLDNWPMNSTETYFDNSLATRDPEYLGDVFSILKKIDETDKLFYITEWKRLKNDKKTSRILENGKIISVEEDYYDQNILDTCTLEYQNAAKIIGEVLSQQKTSVGDHYIFYRIHVLIKNELLEYEGSLGDMRSLNIRKFSK